MQQPQGGTPASPSFRQARDLMLARRGDYEAALRDFRWPRLESFNWALDHFDAEARGNAALAVWLVEEGGSETKLSYAELSARSSQVANFLRQHGVRRGDRLLVMLPNHIALWETMLAGIKLGAVVIPATMLLSAQDLASRVARGRVDHVVTASSETDKFADLPESVTRIVVGAATPGWIPYADSEASMPEFVADGETRANDPMLLYFTSGTTAQPKLVLHSHQSYPVGHLSTMFWIGLQSGDIHYNISSPGWAKHAWSCFFAPLSAGATVFVYNYTRFHAPVVLSILVRCGVTSICAPPTVWRLLVQENLADYPVSLREIVGAGEPLNPEVIERVKAAWNITIRDGFGQTETTAQVGNCIGQPVKPGSMGRPLPGYTIVLLDKDGNPADEGEIAIDLRDKPPSMMLGYEDDPIKTAEANRDGYYRTGDVASRDADGYLTYVGRSDDVFKSADYRISPFELESALIEHPAVAEAAVVLSPDALRLSVPKAFITLCQGFAPSAQLAAEILAFTRQNLAPYQRIRRLQFHELPKTISGKIRRVELRTQEAASVASGERGAWEFWEQDFTDS